MPFFENNFVCLIWNALPFISVWPLLQHLACYCLFFEKAYFGALLVDVNECRFKAWAIQLANGSSVIVLVLVLVPIKTFLCHFPYARYGWCYVAVWCDLWFDICMIWLMIWQMICFMIWFSLSLNESDVMFCTKFVRMLKVWWELTIIEPVSTCVEHDEHDVSWLTLSLSPLV